LLERHYECDVLEQGVAAVIAGRGSIIALEGEAGIGKTSLLAHVSRSGSAAEARVLTARGGELEREFAYGIVRQLFEDPLASAAPVDRERWLAGAARFAVPVVSCAATVRGERPDQSSILHGLYWLAANLSLERPLLLAIDDAHWCDAASIAFLSFLARRVDELPILIVYASRVGEGASAALPAVAEPALVDSVLQPSALSETATETLVGRLLGGSVSGPFAHACHIAARGNPFYLNELLRALEADSVDGEVSTTRVDQIAPQTIARATLARLRGLGCAATDLSFAVAVLGTGGELRHAAALAGLDEERAATAADALVEAGILRDGRPLEFIHPIVRTTMYGELSAARRAKSHKRAARLLNQDGAGDVALAPHLLASGPTGDPWVVDRLHGAAREALGSGAPDAACTYLERACAEPPTAAARLELLLDLGRGEIDLARPTAAARVREVFENSDDAHLRHEAARELVWALYTAGHIDLAVKLGLELLADVRDDDRDLLLRREGDIAAIAQFAPATAQQAQQRLSRYAGSLPGTTPGERMVLACLAYGAAHGDESAATTAQLARHALADGKLMEESELESAAPFYLAVWALIHADVLDEAERCLDVQIQRTRARGWTSSFTVAAGSRCQVLIRQGRLADAEAEAQTVLSGVEPHAISRPMLLSCLLHCKIERSDPSTWQALLSDHAIDHDVSEPGLGGMLLFARANLRLAARDAEAALRDFEQLRELNARSGHDSPANGRRAGHALAYLRVGQPEAARELAAQQLGLARRWNTPSALATALRSAGLIEGGSEGIELLRASADAVEHSSARYERAQSLTEYGAALRRAGHRRDSHEPLRVAVDLADRCGARRLLARARDELIAAGARPRRTAQRGPDALTPSERRVALYAADGLTNREIAQALFVTARTVEGHLTQAFMKLDINSRAQLSTAMAASAD
jgi:DNA-binding CsgD family transcriptional regulator